MTFQILKSGDSILRPRARILRTFGDELISSSSVAISELVKNSYDADAFHVLVKFRGSVKKGEGIIEILDDGHGMALETIKSVWMEPATLIKKKNPYSKGLKRRVLGEKGIGRFATSQLTNTLHLTSREKSMEEEVSAYFDWTQFDDEDKYLDEIIVLWDTVSPNDISPNGIIDQLYQFKTSDKKSSLKEDYQGTILKMEGLRKTWTSKDFNNLHQQLQRLISPHLDLAGSKQFQVFLSLPEPFDYLNGLVLPPETIKYPHYTLNGEVDKDGKYAITLKLRGKTKPIYLSGRIKDFDYEYAPQSGPFEISLNVWDRDQKSIKEYADKLNKKVKTIREDIDRVAGISLYRDGFRVLPYGEEGDDWLNLDRRRINDPSKRLSNNQIIGYVQISADKNPRLKDQSNREGLIEGTALEDLKKSIRSLLSEIETRRENPNVKKRPSSNSNSGLFSNFNLENLGDYIAQNYPSDTVLATLISDKQKDLNQKVEQVQEIISRYQQQVVLGQLVDLLLHDGRAPLAKIRNEAQLGQKNIRKTPNQNRLTTKLNNRFGTIDRQADALRNIFNTIEPFATRKRGRPETLLLDELIQDAFNVEKSLIQQLHVDVSLLASNISVTVEQGDIQRVILNLLQNSLYWLRQVPADKRKIIVQAKRISEKEVHIIFSDSGPGIEEEFQDRIFEPFFSTKPNGTGHGLSVVGGIIRDYYDGDIQLIDPGLSSGANFRIILKRRV